MLSRVTPTVVTASVVFTDRQTGVATSPGLVTCSVEHPDESVDVYTWPAGIDIIEDSAGMFHIDIPALTAGVWTVEWVGSGSGPNVTINGSFNMDESAID